MSIYLNGSLFWEPENVLKKPCRIGMLRKWHKLFDSQSARRIHTAYVRSKLDYATAVFDTLAPTRGDPI